jgi:hypothetical protein
VILRNFSGVLLYVPTYVIPVMVEVNVKVSMRLYLAKRGLLKRK